MFKQFPICMISLLILGAACTSSDTKQSKSDISLELVDKIAIDNDQLIDSTFLGGFSSIEFLEGSSYAVITDDRSEYSPARFYKIDISFDNDGFLNYDFNKVVFLKNKEGHVFAQNELDPESIVYRASSNTYFYSSEGGRTGELINPFVWEMTTDGKFVSEVEIPNIFNFSGEKGLRENGGFESLTIENDSIIWYANELPIKEDSEVPGFKKGKYSIRLVRHDIKNNTILNQYAYDISALNGNPRPEDAFYINSVPEIMYIDDNRLWVLERSYVAGVGNFVKLFEVDVTDATDVKQMAALKGANYTSATKREILDFADYDQKVDNIEGMTFGPDFSDGSRSLLFISDDNFNEEQESQLWLFSVEGI